MKKMRKLLPAFAMLLVSAIMMSTASFAWFTMNSEVTATGMKVQAQSAGGLVIAVSKDYNSAPLETAYAGTVAFTIGNATGDKSWDNQATANPKIAPVSHGVNGAAKGWYYAQASDPTSAIVTGVDYTAVTYDPEAATPVSAYFLHTQCYIRTLAETDGTLYLDSITVTGDNTNELLDSTLRVAINIGDNWYYFAPTREAAPAASEGGRAGFYCANIVEGANNDTAVAMTVNVPSSISDDTGKAEFTNVAIGTLDAAGDSTQEATIVNIYIYFDGEDPQCKSANVKTLVDMGVSLEFSSRAEG